MIFDRDVQSRITAIQEEANRALIGELESNTAIPEFLTPTKTLKLSVELMKLVLNRMKEMIQIFRDEELDIKSEIKSLLQWRAAQEYDLSSVL